MSLSWLMLAGHVPPDGQGGGMVRYAVEMARALNAQAQVELHVVTAPAARPFWEDVLGDGDRVHPMVDAPAVAKGWLERRGLGCRAWGRQFDVVHGTKHLLPRSVVGASLLTVHDFLPMDRPLDFGVLKRRLLPPAYRASIRQADALVCVSEATLDRLVCYVPEVRQRAHVVPLAGSAVSEVHPVEVPRLSGKRYALVVGDDSARKNLRLLTDLWPDVRVRHPQGVLAIVGPPSWKRGDRGHGSNDGIEQLGFLTDAELAWAYRHAAVVLCPSHLEGFGLPAREAVDMLTPLITSDDPALCEVSGSSTLHLPASDRDCWVQAISRALQHGRSEPSAETHRRRCWDDVAEQTVEVMERAVAGDAADR